MRVCVDYAVKNQLLAYLLCYFLLVTIVYIHTFIHTYILRCSISDDRTVDSAGSALAPAHLQPHPRDLCEQRGDEGLPGHPDPHAGETANYPQVDFRIRRRS